ncbi:hypothetical protein O3P69_019030 [Scylla paramamosain]|uniref:Uncharacterized protein n=1 Tax=Scylla paramamosain TaxID=85552 RepID=A0AAW0T7K6_SCYPA
MRLSPGIGTSGCTATIAAVYWQSSEESVEGQLQQTGSVLESKGIYAGGSSSSSTRHTWVSCLPAFLPQALHLFIHLYISSHAIFVCYHIRGFHLPQEGRSFAFSIPDLEGVFRARPNQTPTALILYLEENNLQL